MKDLNEHFFIGRLTADPEPKYTNSGSCVFHFSIAVNTSKKVGEEFVDEPNFFEIVFWPKNVEYWAKQLYKGTKVAVHCEATQDRWEQDGKTRSKVKFRVLGIPEVFPRVQKPDVPAPEKAEDDIPF